MKPHHLGICALLGAGFLAAILHSTPAKAQSMVAAPVINKNTPIGAVTDPQAAVPPVVYQSVFADTPTGVEMKAVDWYRANAGVGQFKRGHVDILKWEEAQTKAATPPKPAMPDAAKPAMPPAPQTPSMHQH